MITDVFENLFGLFRTKTDKYGGLWVKRFNISKENLDTCNGVAKPDPKTRTCAICVALNDTVFHLANRPRLSRHLHCKCEHMQEQELNATLDFDMRKITHYLFVHPSKAGLIESMGYTIEDALEVYNAIAANALARYAEGDYELDVLNCNGQHIDIEIALHGKREKVGHRYEFYTGWIAYPHGKLKNATPFAGWKEKEA